MKNTFEFESPMGRLYIGEESGFITDISFDELNGERRKTDLILKTMKQLEEYFNHGRTEFDIPIKLNGTDFQNKVYDCIRETSYGSTISYGDIAIDIGSSRAYRAVGNALNKNPILIVIPCHRVVKSDGKIGGFREGVKNKNFLLELERENNAKKS